MSAPGSLGYTPSLVGRDRELALLRERLAAAIAGHGSLILIDGEAGIGKTSLAETLCDAATAQGALVLVGQCYDRTETPPYGPWIELFRHYEPDDGPPIPEAFARRGTVGAVASQVALFQQVLDFFTALAAARPLVLLLDDLHWADPASLDLLRFAARSIATQPILLLAAYRTDEVARDDPLYALLPDLIHDAKPQRLNLRPLSNDDLQMLIQAQYGLSVSDEARLVAYLYARAEGNPFFMGELLRTLEGEGALCAAAGGWTLGDITQVHVPTLVRQVIDRRLARFGEEARRLLTVATVIGQEVPLPLWGAIGNVEEERLLALTERAEKARILALDESGAHARFLHALIRESLYEGLRPSQHHALHRAVGEALMASPHADPDAVAYHFRQADDARAVEWLVRAGERAEHAYAWLIAATRYQTALFLIDQHGIIGERGWLQYRIAVLRRYIDPQGGIATLEETARLAEGAGDALLAACARFFCGHLLCYTGDFGAGLVAMEEGVAALDGLSANDRKRLESLGSIGGITLDTHNYRGTLALRLAGTGRFTEARALGDRFIAQASGHIPVRGTDGISLANAYRGVAIAAAAMGRPDEARQAFTRARDLFQQIHHPFLSGVAVMQELQWVVLPYLADQPAEREYLVTMAERAWDQADASASIAELPRRFSRLYLLKLEGAWVEARALAEPVYAANGSYKSVATRVLGAIARDQGNPALAWRLVHEEIPNGPATDVGTGNFATVLLLQRLAATLALDASDLATAYRWLAGHDRWLAWSGSVPGRSEGQALWAQYYRAAGDSEQAHRCAAQVLASATEPRQPLALLTAHRLLGELETEAGRFDEAETHLDRSLNLAVACAAPYERALTLLSFAGMCAAANERDRAVTLLGEARAILMPLDAKPALARADALMSQLTPHVAAGFPAGLTARELEVLCLLAAGHTNRQIAAMLSLSERTVHVHVRNIFGKTGTDNRAGATAFAFRNNLA